eukprot:contig_28662_g7050
MPPLMAAHLPRAPGPPPTPPPVGPEAVLLDGGGLPGREARRARVDTLKRVAKGLATEVVPGGPPLDVVEWYDVENAETLAEDVRSCFSPSVAAQLLAPPNRFPQHLAAIRLITSALGEVPDVAVAVSDTILRWLGSRLGDPRTPPTVLAAAADAVTALVEVLVASGEMLGDYEASAVLPVLVDRLASPREAVRVAVESTMEALGDVMAPDARIVYLGEGIRIGTDVRARATALLILKDLIAERCASQEEMPTSPLAELARHVDDRDDGISRTALECLERVYTFVGEDLWVAFGDGLTQTQVDMLSHLFANTPGPGEVAGVGEDGQPLEGDGDYAVGMHGGGGGGGVGARG